MVHVLLTVLRNDRGMHFVYIMASRPGGALYVGETRDLSRRIDQHRSGHGSVHTAKYKNRTLVWYQAFEDSQQAKTFELRLKKWRRAWKDKLITDQNPDWRDLSATLGHL
ncbi:MAG: GIY-YIG nuclease family protein [Pseudomonadota bacterium]